MSARNDQRVSPVVAMVDDAAASRPTAEIERFALRQLFANECDFLGIAERESRGTPPIMAKPRSAFLRVTLQQQEIDRHVFSCAGCAVGENLQARIHGFI